jgi:hypothetical protein
MPQNPLQNWSSILDILAFFCYPSYTFPEIGGSYFRNEKRSSTTEGPMANYPIQINIHINNLAKAQEIADKLGIKKEDKDGPEVAQLVNEARIAEANERQLPRVRKGIGDTGHQTFGRKGLQNARLDKFLLEDLRERNYKAVHAYWFQTSQLDQHTGEIVGEKFVIRVKLAEPRDIDSTLLPDEFLDRFAEYLGQGSWSYCHVWENKYLDTVNLVGVMDTEAKRFTRLRLNDLGGYITERIEPPAKEGTVRSS